MAQTTSRFPTYEFANDPLPPRMESPAGEVGFEPERFRPTETVHLGDMEFQITQRVDGATPWRETGNTDLEHFLSAISRTHPPATQSPLVAEARELYEILREAGLSRFAAAMLWHEKKNDTWADSPIPVQFRNPFSTRDRARPGEWEQFSSYADAARAWVARIGKDPYPQNGTIAQFVHIYAPAHDNNDEALYVTMLANGINDLPFENALPAPPKGKPIAIAGLPNPVFVPTDFPFEMILTPPGPNRPGHHMDPQGVTQHETNNQNAGFGARGHSRWQDDGTPGHPTPPVGVHFYVDDTVVIQKIPVNEVSIHAGSPGDETHISVELCVNADRDVRRAERNAMTLAAALLRDGLHRGPEALMGHNDWWSENPCPRVLRAENRWPVFKQTVGELINEVRGQQPSFPGLPPGMPVEVFLALFPQANPEGPVTKFYIDYCVSHLPPGQWPRLNESRPLSDGTTWWDFNPLHIFSNTQGKVWIAGDTERQSSPRASTRPATLGDLAGDESASSRETAPARDYAAKDAAVARDASRRLAVTASATDLLAAPGGELIRTLSAGIGLIVLGDAEDGFVPVDVMTRAGDRGYVAESAIADDFDTPESAQNRPRHREDKDKRKTSGRGSEPGGGRKSGKPRKSNGRGEPDPSGQPDRPVTTGGSGASTSTATGEHGDRIAAEARNLIGRRYVWATHGPDTFDCSGLVHWVVLQATGQNISPDSHAQFNTGTPVEWDLLRPGDVVFYDTMEGAEVREGNRASHVGIFIGGGRMVNALNEQAGVREDDPFSAYFKPKYLGGRRMA